MDSTYLLPSCSAFLRRVLLVSHVLARSLVSRLRSKSPSRSTEACIGFDSIQIEVSSFKHFDLAERSRGLLQVQPLMHLLESTAVPAGLPIWAKGKNRTASSLFGH